MKNRRISYVDNPNDINDPNNKQNLSLNELINANFSVIENQKGIINETLNEDNRNFASPIMKNLTDKNFDFENDSKNFIINIDGGNENNHNCSIRRGNCERRSSNDFLSKICLIIKIN